MATINFATREITAKLVYFGASGTGCNTNLRILHGTLPAVDRSRLHKFGPGDTKERSFFFDCICDDTRAINSFPLRLQLYTLPGGVDLEAHRDEVLRDVDGVVFVSDARNESEQSNMESLLQLEQQLSRQGLELEATPIVLQVNNVRAEGARSVQDVVYDINPYDLPVIQAHTADQEGVLETLNELLDVISTRIRDKMAGNHAAITLKAVHESKRPTDESIIRKHISAIRETAGTTPGASVGAEVSLTSRSSQVVRVPYLPQSFLGGRPVQILQSELLGENIVLDIMVGSPSATARPLTVILESEQRDTAASQGARAMTPSAISATASSDASRVADYLPDSYTPPPEPAADMPAWLYGLIGVLGGALIGILGTMLVQQLAT